MNAYVYADNKSTTDTDEARAISERVRKQVDVLMHHSEAFRMSSLVHRCGDVATYTIFACVDKLVEDGVLIEAHYEAPMDTFRVFTRAK